MPNASTPLDYLSWINVVVAFTVIIFKKEDLQVKEGALVISIIKNTYYLQSVFSSPLYYLHLKFKKLKFRLIFICIIIIKY